MFGKGQGKEKGRDGKRNGRVGKGRGGEGGSPNLETNRQSDASTWKGSGGPLKFLLAPIMSIEIPDGI